MWYGVVVVNDSDMCVEIWVRSGDQWSLLFDTPRFHPLHNEIDQHRVGALFCLSNCGNKPVAVPAEIQHILDTVSVYIDSWPFLGVETKYALQRLTSIEEMIMSFSYIVDIIIIWIHCRSICNSVYLCYCPNLFRLQIVLYHQPKKEYMRRQWWCMPVSSSFHHDRPPSVFSSYSLLLLLL